MTSSSQPFVSDRQKFLLAAGAIGTASVSTLRDCSAVRRLHNRGLVKILRSEHSLPYVTTQRGKDMYNRNAA